MADAGPARPRNGPASPAAGMADKKHAPRQSPSSAAAVTSPPSPADGPPQKGEAQRAEKRRLFLVRGPVSAIVGLVEEHRLTQRVEPGGHLAGMAGVDAVVAARGDEQHR